MANPEHVQRLRTQAKAWAQWKAHHRKRAPWGEGVDHDHVVRTVLTWNIWRTDNPDIVPDLSGAMFAEADLSFAILRGVNLSEACLVGANLEEAYCEDANFCNANLEQAKFQGGTFRGANLRGAKLNARIIGNAWGGARLANMDFSGADLRTYLYGADFDRSNLSGANLSGATFTNANFSEANLSGANLSNARLSGADFGWANLRNAQLCGALMIGTSLLKADLRNADLNGAYVYGVSAWDVELEGANQSNLILTQEGKSPITVDNLEVAQFIYLLLNNKKIRDVIETIGKKAVLILGNFKPERKAVLEGIREALRERGYLPILFDFDTPTNRDLTETVSALAHLSRFIIADITDARSIPQELSAIVPNLPSVPVQPLLLFSQHEYGMFEHFKRFPQVLETRLYRDIDELLASLAEGVIEPAEAKVRELKSLKSI